MRRRAMQALLVTNLSVMQKPNQKGGALIIFAVILVLAATAFLISQLNGSSVKIERDKTTAEALAKAKIALIGWSISRGRVGTERPGELPCPDTDEPGTISYGLAEGTCVAGKVGRFPWKSVGSEELKDGYGEPLWYAVDGAFRVRFGVSPTTNRPINSDSRASMQIYAEDGITLITQAGDEVAAVIFAPGYPTNGQSRSPGSSTTCPATGTNILENRCATNYLELQNGRNNSINNGPFIRGKKTDIFNDSLIFIYASKLMSVTEKRVGKDLKNILENYHTANGYYPYPARFDTVGCLDVDSNASVSDCESDATICRGRLPDKALPSDWAAGYLLPNWFEYNLWGQTIFYSVGTDSLASIPADCSNNLTVDLTNHESLFILAGTPIGTKIRNNLTQSLVLSDYLEDLENQDSWDLVANNLYIKPTTVGDSLYVLP